MLREFVKGLIILFILAAFIAAALAWIDDQPSQRTWLFRIGSPIAMLLSFVLFLKIHFQRDEVPDYLSTLSSDFYDRGGFCFAFRALIVNDVCLLRLFFQNRHERPCVGQVALRSTKGFFGGRKIDTITFEISCAAAGFGFAQTPVPVPQSIQGKRHTFEIGASVEYPEGKGRMLRFRDGAVIRTNTNFGSDLTGHFTPAKPVTVTIDFPTNVIDELSEDQVPEVNSMWQLGDIDLDRLTLLATTNNP